MPLDLRQRWQDALRSIDLSQIDDDFAACEPTARELMFSGFVRRTIHRAGWPLTLVAEKSDMDAKRLTDFLRGRGPLDRQELDRLLESLGVELVGTHPQRLA
jgi:hypothetical protein